MLNPQHGYLLISDITGYTMYLSQSELEHAQGILTALLELLIDHTRPPLIISRLAGDAVISYALGDNFYHGQTFIEVIEDTYVAFRKALERMVLNNTCRCKACTNISMLDLKFFVHYGHFGIQRLADHNELVGSDVNLIHRLLKNHVAEQTGIRAYTLYTASALRQLGLENFEQMLVLDREEYEHLGEVQVWVQDMHSIWGRKRSASTITISPGQVVYKVETDIALPPMLVWDYLIQPEYRKVLIGTARYDVFNRSFGRIGPGSVYQCYHGDRAHPQAVLEWQPFERIVTQDAMPVPFKNTYALVEYRLVPSGEGTNLSQVISRARGPWLGRMLCALILPMMQGQGRKDMDAFRQLIEADFASRKVEPIPNVKLTRESLGAIVAAELSGNKM